MLLASTIVSEATETANPTARSGELRKNVAAAGAMRTSAAAAEIEAVARAASAATTGAAADHEADHVVYPHPEKNGCRSNVRNCKRMPPASMAGYLITPVLVFWTGLLLHWVKFTF